MSGVEVRRQSRSTSSYLFCRGGAYYLRVRVPLRHQDRVGSIEVRRSLHVHHPRTARRLALKLSARVFEVFDMLETTALTKPQVQGLLQQAFRDMERSAGIGFIPTGPCPDLEIVEQRDLSKERIASLSEQIADLSFSPEIKVKAMLVAGYVDTDPTATLKIKLPQKKQALADDRRPFTKEELVSLFSSPLYSGCKSPRHRLDPGHHRLSDGKFWIPLVGHYTGLRLGEIVQLHLDDVILAGAIPYLFVREEGGTSPGGADAKHVKSKAGIRKVPIHPDLIALGFDKFVAKVHAKRKGKGRLFFDIGYRNLQAFARCAGAPRSNRRPSRSMGPKRRRWGPPSRVGR